MRIYDPLLYPFAMIYDGITRLRNRLFDIGAKKSTNFEIPTIVVGNLSLGGTGKTPMVEFLIEALKGDYQIATLSRGYGRKTRGYRMATKGSNANELGDEPFQIFQKYGEEVSVSVGEERVLAIPYILVDRPDTNLILLDDAFQHRYLKGDFYLLLTTFQKPFFKDNIVPLGTLREHPKGARRADMVVVTKCPDILEKSVEDKYTKEITYYTGKDCPVLFAGIKYGEIYSVLGKKPEQIGKRAIILTGIADNRVFLEEVKKKYEILDVLEFPDHHRYTEKNMIRILASYENHKGSLPFILTTEKDAAKLKAAWLMDYLREIPIFALPMKIELTNRDKGLILKKIAEAMQKKIQREN